jgi:acetaldehyde dehydrogenase (acetylating)
VSPAAVSDQDLLSIQEARELARQAHEAAKALYDLDQRQVDAICAAMAQAGAENAERLGRMAQEETGYGVAAHKTLKNLIGSREVWESIKDLPSVGVIRRDPVKKVVEIAEPAGVIAALTPSTNPTSTVMFKVICSLKGRNACVVAPHPAAVRCCVETAQVLAQAAERAGAPQGAVSCMTRITLPGSQELMKAPEVALVLATGGPDIVRAALTSGKPSIVVGGGNVPVYVDRSADVALACRNIVNGKTFDYSTLCSTEQNVIADQPVAAQVREELKSNGCHFCSSEQKAALERIFLRPGGFNPQLVGKPATFLAEQAGFSVPPQTRVLVVELKGMGRADPMSREKLTTILGILDCNGWEEGLQRSIEALRYGGLGHSASIHAQDERVVEQMALRLPAYRIVVNTVAAPGTVGGTTGLMPSMTLGCGPMGGSPTGDNISAMHLFHVKRLAWATKPWEQPGEGPSSGAAVPTPPAGQPRVQYGGMEITYQDVEAVVRRVLERL